MLVASFDHQELKNELKDMEEVVEEEEGPPLLDTIPFFIVHCTSQGNIGGARILEVNQHTSLPPSSSFKTSSLIAAEEDEGDIGWLSDKSCQFPQEIGKCSQPAYASHHVVVVASHHRGALLPTLHIY